MSSLMPAESMPPNHSIIALGSATTTANKDGIAEDALELVPQEGEKRRWLELFHKLPTELHLNIMEVMDKDPVAQICFGLTNRYFYQVYHIAKDYVQYDGLVIYPIKTNPLDLRMQISTCEEYMYHGWVEPWKYLDDIEAIEWHPSLGDLVRNETIWGDLCYCAECAKYKPKEAFARSEYEKSIEEKGIKWKETIEAIFGGNADFHCKRCRAKTILIHVQDRDEWKEDQTLEEHKASLGLRKLDWEDLIVDGDSLRDRLTLQNFLEVVGGYETWEEVFEKLGV